MSAFNRRNLSTSTKKKKKKKSKSVREGKASSDAEAFISAKAILTTENARKMMLEYLQDRLGLSFAVENSLNVNQRLDSKSNPFLGII